MNEEEKRTLKSLIVQQMMEYRGAQIDRVKANNYLNIDTSGLEIAEKILQELENKFEMKPKDKGTVRWEE